jgi:hypothetical protein
MGVGYDSDWETGEQKRREVGVVKTGCKAEGLRRKVQGEV